MSLRSVYSSKPFFITLAIILLAVGGLGIYKAVHHGSADSVSSPDKPKVDLSPATEQEKKETETHKDQLAKDIQQSNTSSNSTSSKKQVSVVITSASQDVINAYVGGVFEEGGTCTAMLTGQSGQSFIKSSKGFENVSNTQCAPIRLSAQDFPSKGNWSVIVSYASDKAQGTSSPASIEVR